jgi:hypothetical protein
MAGSLWTPSAKTVRGANPTAFIKCVHARQAATWPDTVCPRELHLYPQKIGWEL